MHGQETTGQPKRRDEIGTEQVSTEQVSTEQVSTEQVSTEQVSTKGASAAEDSAKAGTRDEIPVACSLTPAGLAAQAGRWERLAARAMANRTETPRGLRIEFRPEPGAEEELRALAAVEAECCPWAAWAVEASGGRILLDVHSAGDGIAALHGMFTGLRPAPPLPPG